MTVTPLARPVCGRCGAPAVLRGRLTLTSGRMAGSFGVVLFLSLNPPQQMIEPLSAVLAPAWYSLGLMYKCVFA